jgi:hypothetical protein
MSEDKKPPVKRSLSLSQKTNSDLLSLADVLGINPHQYMVNELAKCIQRDLLVYKSTQDTSNQLSAFIAAMEEQVKAQDEA